MDAGDDDQGSDRPLFSATSWPLDDGDDDDGDDGDNHDNDDDQGYSQVYRNAS